MQFSSEPCWPLSFKWPWSQCYLLLEMVQMVKNLPAMRETQVWSLGWEDPPEKGMATHSSILAWRIPRTEGLGELQSIGSKRVRHNWATNTSSAYYQHLGIVSMSFSSTILRPSWRGWPLWLQFWAHRCPFLSQFPSTDIQTDQSLWFFWGFIFPAWFE